MTTYYATPEDVKAVIQNVGKFSAFQGFDANSTPTRDEVNSIINSAEDWIDGWTKHAWRTKTVTNEMADMPKQYKVNTGRAVYLKHRAITTFSHAAGDKIEVWDGGAWVDYLTTRTEGRNNDYWVDYSNGVIYIMLNIMFYVSEQSVRITYRYGETSVPNDIKRATALVAAAEIITSDDRSFVLPETGDATRMVHDSRYDKWMDRAKIILQRYIEF